MSFSPTFGGKWDKAIVTKLCTHGKVGNVMNSVDICVFRFQGTWILAEVENLCFPSASRLGLTAAALTCSCDNYRFAVDLPEVSGVRYVIPEQVCYCSNFYGVVI